MARRTAFRAVLAAALLAALAACTPSSAARTSAGNTIPIATEPAPTTTTNPYAIPAVIDVAYVNRVLAGLDLVRGDVTRDILSSQTIPKGSYERMRAIYGTDEWLQLRIDSFQSDMRRGFAGYRSNPGNQVTTVSQLLTVTKLCIFARVTRDYSAVGPGASTTSDKNWVGLIPLDPKRDPNGFNPTSWSFSYDGFPPDHSQPADLCAKSA